MKKNKYYLHSSLKQIIQPYFHNGCLNPTDVQAEHSYSLSEDSAPQSPALSIKMDQESGRSSCSLNGFTQFKMFFLVYALREKKYVTGFSLAVCLD